MLNDKQKMFWREVAWYNIGKNAVERAFRERSWLGAWSSLVKNRLKNLALAEENKKDFQSY